MQPDVTSCCSSACHSWLCYLSSCYPSSYLAVFFHVGREGLRYRCQYSRDIPGCRLHFHLRLKLSTRLHHWYTRYNHPFSGPNLITILRNLHLNPLRFTASGTNDFLICRLTNLQMIARSQFSIARCFLVSLVELPLCLAEPLDWSRAGQIVELRESHLLATLCQ